MEDDIHKKTAALIFNKRPEDVTPAERQRGKWANFEAQYGQPAEETKASDKVQVKFVHADGDETYFEIERKNPPSRTLTTTRGLSYPCEGAGDAVAAIKNSVGRVWRDKDLNVPRVVAVYTDADTLSGMLDHDAHCAVMRSIFMLQNSDGRTTSFEGPPHGYDLTGVALRTPDGVPYTDTKFR